MRYRRTMRAAWVAIVACAGCFVTPVMHFGGPSSQETQKKTAVKLTPPGLVVTGEGWSGDVSVAKIRVWADEDYRAQNVRWRDTFAEQLAYANELLGPLLGVRLEAEYRDWPYRPPAGSTLAESLAALAKQDPGTDVLSVVGLTSALSLVSATFEQLGYASVPGRHLVVRGYADVFERVAFDRAFRDLSKQERDTLYVARRRHKTTAILLHELAHNLGAPHVDQPETIMNPMYSERSASFDMQSRELALSTLDARLHRKRAVAEVRPPTRAHPTVVVTLTDTGDSLVGGRVIDGDTLGELLRLSFQDDPETEVVVKASARTPHTAVIGVIDRANAVGLHRVSLASDNAP
jgi:biopolymer transport protein ExbD